MTKLRTMKIDEITLRLDPNRPDTVLIYVSGMTTQYGRAWYGGTTQEAANIAVAWHTRDFDRVRLLLRGKDSTTGRGEAVCDAIDAHLAAAPQLNTQYDAYDPTTVTFESTDDGHGGWYVRCVQAADIIYWWGGAFECDDLACYLNNGHYQEAYDLLFKDWSGITTHGEHLVKTMTTLIKKQQDDTDLLVDTDTWGIGNKPHAKVKQWEPDTPDPDVDLMKSIRDACHR